MTQFQPSPPRRLPNPWVAVPVLVAAAVGWFVGTRVAGLSCEPNSCTGSEVLWGSVGALIGFVGTLVVSVLVVRSLAEWAALSTENKRLRQEPKEAKELRREPPTS